MFGQSVQAWQTFYGTIATASAGLVGLLFVALSLNSTILVRTESAHLRALALQTFTTFVIIIGLSLMFLIPDPNSLGLGLPLLCIAFGGLVASIRRVRPLLSAKHPSGVFYEHVGLRLIALLIVALLAGRIVIVGDAGTLYWFVAPMMILLISATLHVWSLLVGIQQALLEK